MSEVACTRWHRLGERCECGHVTVPARFHWIGDKELTQGKAEERYMEFLKECVPALWKKLQTFAANKAKAVVSRSANTSANTASANTSKVCKCGKPARPRGKDCWTCYRARGQG